MFTVLMILLCLVAVWFAPYAAIAGMIGYVVADFWGALTGVILGLCMQFEGRD